MKLTHVLKTTTASLAMLVLLTVASGIPTLAASLTTTSLSLSDPRPSQTGVSYTGTFSNVSTSAIKCIQLVFSNAATAGTVPTGMTTTSAALSGTSTYIPTPSGWAVGAATNGTVKLTNAAGETPASAAGRTIMLTGITNGSVVETGYYLQLSTFSNTDCVTGPVDSSTIMYIFTNGQVVTATVDPTLTFTVAAIASGGTVNGTTTNVTTTNGSVPFGTLSTATNKIAGNQLSIGTNAQLGYTVSTRYTGALQNAGVYSLTDHTGTNATPTAFPAAGTEAFGYTTDAVPGFLPNKWAAYTTSNATIASAATPGLLTFKTGYQLGIASTTRAGSYSTTIVYSAIPTY